MTKPRAPDLKSSTARILRGSGEETAGTGLLLQDGLVATCAHVVRTALGVGPTVNPDAEAVVGLRFPHGGEPNRVYHASVAIAGWRSEADVAILKLNDEPPYKVGWVTDRNLSNQETLDVSCFGYGESVGPDGDTAEARIPTQAICKTWASLRNRNDPTALTVEPGYSGAPVYDNNSAVLGLIRRDGTVQKKPTAHMILISVVTEALASVLQAERNSSPSQIGRGGLRPAAISSPRSEKQRGKGDDPGSRSERARLSDQINLVEATLSDNNVSNFLEIIFDSFQRRDLLPARDVTDLIETVISAHPDSVQEIFWAIRDAIDLVGKEAGSGRPASPPVARAALALYILAACRLVDIKIYESNNYIVPVQIRQPLVCAVIATALFGGELTLVPDSKQGNPRPRYVYDIDPVAGEELRDLAGFERVFLFSAVPTNKDEEVNHYLDGVGVSSFEPKFGVKTFLNEYRGRLRKSISIIVDPCHSGVAENFSSEYSIPVFYQKNDSQSTLLGWKEEELILDLQGFWSRLNDFTSDASPEKTDAGIADHDERPERRTSTGDTGRVTDVTPTRSDNVGTLDRMVRTLEQIDTGAEKSERILDFIKRIGIIIWPFIK